MCLRQVFKYSLPFEILKIGVNQKIYCLLTMQFITKASNDKKTGSVKFMAAPSPTKTLFKCGTFRII